MLTASEATIYRRFGYGVASRLASRPASTAARSAFAAPVPAEWSLRLVDDAEAVELGAGRASTRTWPSGSGRADPARAVLAGHLLGHRDAGWAGASTSRWCATRRPAARPAGYAIYKVKREGRRGSLGHRGGRGGGGRSRGRGRAVAVPARHRPDRARSRSRAAPLDDPLRVAAGRLSGPTGSPARTTSCGCGCSTRSPRSRPAATARPTSSCIELADRLPARDRRALPAHGRHRRRRPGRPRPRWRGPTSRPTWSWTSPIWARSTWAACRPSTLAAAGRIVEPSTGRAGRGRPDVRGRAPAVLPHPLLTRRPVSGWRRSPPSRPPRQRTASPTMRATMNTISAVHSQPMPSPSGEHGDGAARTKIARRHQHGHGQEAQVAGADQQAVEHEHDAVDRLHDGRRTRARSWSPRRPPGRW